MAKSLDLKKEIRMADLRMEPVGNEDMTITGYPVVFDAPTILFEVDGVAYSEVIRRGALDGADISDVPLKYNHSDSVMIMARTRNKTLSLAVDEKGLKMTARLANTTSGKDIYELVRRGDLDKMSFAFWVAKDSYDANTRTRTIEKISKIGDVSIVDFPAYEQTSVSARDYFSAQIEAERKIKEELESRRRKLIIATYL